MAPERHSSFLTNLGPGGATTLTLAFATGLVGAGIPILWRGVQVLRQARRDERRPSDAIVVLGRQLEADQPTEVFRARLDHGAALWRDRWAPLLIVSGGLTGFARQSEAAAGRDYLISRGIPAPAIRIEEGSRHTLENMGHVRAHLRAAGLSRVILVSDPLHLARAAALARGFGLDVACSPAAAAPPRPGAAGWWARALREAFFLHWYQLGVAYSRAIGSKRLLGRVT